MEELVEELVGLAGQRDRLHLSVASKELSVEYFVKLSKDPDRICQLRIAASERN